MSEASALWLAVPAALAVVLLAEYRRRKALQEHKAELESATQAMQAERKLRTLAQMELQQSVLSGVIEGTSSAMKLLRGGGMSVPYPLTPIGTVRSCFTDQRGAPSHPLLAPAARAELCLRPGVAADALSGLEQFSHCWLVYIFHEEGDLNRLWEPHGGTVNTQVDVRGGGKLGVLATRGGERPSPIGLSVAKIAGVLGSSLLLEGADVLDGTPVLDVKPYVPPCDTVPSAVAPAWAGPPLPGPRADGAAALPRDPVTFSPIGRSQLASSWWAVHTGERGSLYHSAAEFADLVTQVLTLKILERGRGGGREFQHTVSTSVVRVEGEPPHPAPGRPPDHPHVVHSVVLEEVVVQYVEGPGGRLVVTGCHSTKGAAAEAYPELDSTGPEQYGVPTERRRPGRRGSV